MVVKQPSTNVVNDCTFWKAIGHSNDTEDVNVTKSALQYCSRQHLVSMENSGMGDAKLPPCVAGVPLLNNMSHIRLHPISTLTQRIVLYVIGRKHDF